MTVRKEKSDAIQERKQKMLWMTLQGIAKDLPKLSQPEKHVLARMVSNSIFDMRYIWSGMESQALVDAKAKDSKTKRCAEHFYPRQLAGARIIQHVERYGGISQKKLNDFLDIFCKVHYTTSEENIKLKAYQKVDTFISPEHSYASAGITLVKVK